MNLVIRLLRPCLDPAATIRSIVARGVAQGLADGDGADPHPAGFGIDVLLASPEALTAAMPPVAEDFPFPAVVLVALPASPRTRAVVDRLRRDLFDRGLVETSSCEVPEGVAHGFLLSSLVSTLDGPRAAPQGRITVSTLGRNGRFGNQLFQYAFARLYALRHGLIAGVPEWEGARIYGLDDPGCGDAPLERWTFPGFTDDDRKLWEWDEPPVDIDAMGYFQELPACWRRHRPLLRRLFELPAAERDAMDDWRRRATDGGRRTLVAIHVRRGDYRSLQHELPYFRLVPEAWYAAWLRRIWPTLRDPVLFVATDEPESVAPAFAGFDTVKASFDSAAGALPAHVRDFEALRRADHLALCNSSFSRMAALLAPDRQRSYLPSMEKRRFLPYEPWIDPRFWARFDGRDEHPSAHGRRADAPMVRREGDDARDATLLFDVSHLLDFLARNAAVTGIQRVQCELARQLLAIPDRPLVRLVALDRHDRLAAIDAAAFVAILDGIEADATDRAAIGSRLAALVDRAVPYAVRPRDVFVIVGAFWVQRRMGRLLRELKDAGALVTALVNDVLPIEAPEFFQSGATKIFVKGMVELWTFADAVLTASECSKAAMANAMAAGRFRRLPIHALPLARERTRAAPAASAASEVVRALLGTTYVLCVGTIEVRKNPAYLFQLWKLLVASGRADVPTLVFAGRRGWLVRDFLDQLASCDYLDGRIVIVEDATDADLDALYRHCLLTMFPSFAEGWGLPVCESLAYGKVCLCSAASAIPEAGGAAADYLDPYNVRDGLARLVRYLDDPGALRRREREIGERFEPRSWRSVAEGLLASTLALTRQLRPIEDALVIRLPAGRFLPVSCDAGTIPHDGLDGSLCADLACIDGWEDPGVAGVRAAGASAVLRFRTDTAAGGLVVVALRLSATDGALRVQIRADGGGEADVALPAGGEGVGVLSSRVDAEGVVVLRLSTIAGPEVAAGAPFGTLRGFMYFDPARNAGAGARSTRVGEMRPAPSTPSAGDDAERHDGAARRWLELDASPPDVDRRRAATFGDFLQSTDSWWLSEGASRLDPPIVVDDADARAFAAGREASPHAVPLGHDRIRLVRQSDVFVSMARFTEGSVFDRSGVRRGMAFLQTAPGDCARWLASDPGGVRVDAGAMDSAPYVDASCLVFFNGNLHNYYHWVAEALPGLDLLTRALGPDSRRRVLLPASRHVHAVFDHRRVLAAVGLDAQVEDVAADLVRVREAIWLDSDLVQTMPVPHLDDFRRGVATRYRTPTAGRRRRLLIRRRGPQRSIANAAEVEGALSALGFESVMLEGMDIEEQIAMFRNAEFVVGAHGAGLANLLFCDPGTRVVELMPSAEFRPFFWVIAGKLGLVYGIRFCRTVEGDGFQGVLDVDVDKLLELVRRVDAAAVVANGRGVASAGMRAT